MTEISTSQTTSGAPAPSTQDSASKHPSVAIIGFGPAGLNAAIGLRTSGYTGPINVFSDIETLPYSPILTSYYAGGDKTYEECFPWSQEEIDSLNLNLHTNCPVEKLDTEQCTIHTPHGTFPFEKCVIATGATPSLVGFPPCDYEPLVLHSMDDAERLKTVLEAPEQKRILVSGASMVALKILEACLHHNATVTLVGMNPHVLDYNALPQAAERFERGLRNKHVELRLGQTMSAISVREDDTAPTKRVLRVTFSNGDQADFDEIAVAHGMRGNLDFLDPQALTIDRGIVVDDYMRTSNPAIYAAGDIVQAKEIISGQPRIVGIWKNAALQGQCAGRAIAAELSGHTPAPDAVFPGSLSTNTIAVDGTLFISAGSVELNDNRHVHVEETDDMTVVYVYDESDTDHRKRLVGFNITCDYDEEGSLAYDKGAILTMFIERAWRA